MDGWIGWKSPGGGMYRAPYGANNLVQTSKEITVININIVIIAIMISINIILDKEQELKWGIVATPLSCIITILLLLLIIINHDHAHDQ